MGGNFMLTFFTIPKPFTRKNISIIQQNAIKSWTFLRPKCEVIMLANDRGVAQFAQSLKVKHLSNISCNQFGTPLLNSAFNLLRKRTKNNTICYINADIILPSNFMDIFQYLPKKDFLVVGERWDLDVKKKIDFSNPGWEKLLMEDLRKKGKKHRLGGNAGSDYFIFKKNLFKNLPPFAVGRVGWDNWMIYEARKKGMLVIDASPLVKVIHQNHDYAHQINKGKDKRKSPEGKRNIELAGGEKRLFNLQNTNWQLTPQGLKRKINRFNLVNTFKRLGNFFLNKF
jgi:hypothetical protein